MSEVVSLLDGRATIHVGDVRESLRAMEAGSVQCCVTSPPYWSLRDYGTATWEGGSPECEHTTTKSLSAGHACIKCGALRVDRQIGLESTPEAYVQTMVDVFREVRRVLRDDGTVWMNLGDSFCSTDKWGGGKSGNTGKHTVGEGGFVPSWAVREKREPIPNLKPKDLCGIPWTVALALRADGWYLRSDIIWAKPNPMPESVTDRPTKSHEYIFLLSKSDRYFFDAEAVKEGAIKGHAGSRFDIGKTAVNGNGRVQIGERIDEGSRNIRTVWNIATQSFTGRTDTVRWLDAPQGATGDDIRRTTSPDCPVHGDRDQDRRGERANDSSIHTSGTCDRPEQGRPPEVQCTATPHDQQIPACGSGSPDPSRSPIATSRSIRTRKTARALSTTPPCTPSAQTGTDTPGTSTPPDSCGSVGHTPANSTGADSVSDGPDSGLLGRTSSDIGSICTCKYHRRVTQETSHFATFPEAIPDRCIRAGTSEKGACPKCGAGWVRVVERDNDGTRQPGSNRAVSMGHTAVGPTAVLRAGEPMTSHTVGWSPACSCNAGPPVPCLVLDPFLGSGTTLAVAAQLGRRGVGCELNPAYVELARDRIGKAARPNTHASTRVVDSPLFGGQS